MPRPGQRKIDFYPDDDAWQALEQLPSGVRNSTLNNLVKSWLGQDATQCQEAQANLIEVLKRKQGTSTDRYALSFPETARRSLQVLQTLCQRYNIAMSQEAAKFGTLVFQQELKKLSINPDDARLDTTEVSLEVEVAFFQAVAHIRFWESCLADDVPFKPKQNASHPS